MCYYLKKIDYQGYLAADLFPYREDTLGCTKETVLNLKKYEETPANILISVDFPAPFSPTSACTSPGQISNWTSSSALSRSDRHGYDSRADRARRSDRMLQNAA